MGYINTITYYITCQYFTNFNFYYYEEIFIIVGILMPYFAMNAKVTYTYKLEKPLTLMNGANLLYLLEKHGHKAQIDIAEAKKIQNGQ